MKQLNLTLFLLIGSVSLHAQSDQKWFSYWNEDTTLTGFKNAKGEILAEPKFIMNWCEEFETVVAVVEQINEEEFSCYYLRADGTKFAEDSVYFFDQIADKEREGVIRFIDPETKKVGLMDAFTGRIILSAVYDEMLPIEFGFIRALKGAKKDFWEEHEDDGCGHFSWVGGQSLLISIEGDVLSTKFLMNKKGEYLYENLDYSEFERSKKPSSDTMKMSFKAKDGGYISFVSLDKTFDHWAEKNLFQQANEVQFRQIVSDSLIIWIEEQGWTVISKTDLFSGYQMELRLFFEMIRSQEYTHFTATEDFFLYDFALFEPYLDDCGEFDSVRYPWYEVVVTSKKTDEESHLSFLRNEQGWQLVGLTLR